MIFYDRAYRLVHGLDRPRAQVEPALCVEVRRCRRARTLPDGTRIRPGDRLGILHLNNARIANVMAQMTRHRVRQIPVVEGGKLRGIVSIGDAVQHRLDELELEANVLREAYITRH